ncbi:hypothetical protein [Micromonospora echinofusca]|uniref:Uncharacterized protein n=1 Tax=Micromonospora echinofusca TaxID=47858 RepID=A0ABS3VPF2_MICEH|nr:hypothetical protein [Micromonospora echinofusca]MBO4206425.1 hypothetical protein [Micromonospora echinofusca]
MGKHSRTATDGSTPRQSREAASEHLGTGYWSVDDCAWPTVQPDLPGHLVDLLAPPIVVGVAPVAAPSRLSFPGPAVPVPARSRPGPVPAARLRPVGPPPVPAPTSPGRHRRPGDPA